MIHNCFVVRSREYSSQWVHIHFKVKLNKLKLKRNLTFLVVAHGFNSSREAGGSLNSEPAWSSDKSYKKSRCTHYIYTLDIVV